MMHLCLLACCCRLWKATVENEGEGVLSALLPSHLPLPPSLLTDILTACLTACGAYACWLVGCRLWKATVENEGEGVLSSIFPSRFRRWALPG